MTSIITSNFRLLNAENFVTSFVSDNYYLFIGRPQPWANDNISPSPIDSAVAISESKRDILAMKKIGSNDLRYSIPRYNWTTATVYDQYAHDYNSENPSSNGFINLYDSKFYVVNSSYQVYKCISNNNGNPSSVEPTGTGNSIFTTADSYAWKYMYSIGVNDVVSFVTPDYIPVFNETNVVNSAINGGVHKIVMLNGGSGYTTAGVTIDGDGSGLALTPLISAGAIIGFTVTNPGTGYSFVNLTITGNGIGATAKAIISPPGGHGKNAIAELGGFNVTISVNLQYDEGGDFTVSNDFRRMGIVVNPYNYGTTTPSTATTLDATYSMTLNVGSGVFIADDIITGGTSGAKARVVSYDSLTSKLKYIKSVTENNIAFSSSETITNQTAQTGTIASLTHPEYEIGSGTVIYTDQRRALSRAADQIEQIVITLEF